MNVEIADTGSIVALSITSDGSYMVSWGIKCSTLSSHTKKDEECDKNKIGNYGEEELCYRRTKDR